MPQRDIENLNQVTDVIAERPAEYAKIAEQVGSKIIENEQKAKINDNISKANMDLRQVDNEFRTQYQDDPFNEQGLNDLQQKKQKIFDTYGSDISPFFKNQWLEDTSQLSRHSDTMTEAWQYSQSSKNAKVNLRNSIDNNLTMANQDGVDYGSGTVTDIGALANMHMSREQLAKFSNGQLGSEDSQALLKDYSKDYMKSFIAGVASTSPQKAAELLDTEDFKKNFTTEEINTFTGLIAKTEKQNELRKTLQNTTNSGEVHDLINDPDKSFFAKMLTIDKLELYGSLPPKIATQARRVLTSQKEVDAITSTPVMSDLITKIYDLNSQSSNSEDYLKGVQNIQNDILQKQADGELNVIDAQKLNNEVRTLTSKKVSDATKSVGNDFFSANELFLQLPPEDRGTATRELFYKTAGQDLTSDQQKVKAQGIIDNVNNAKRNEALKVISNLNGNSTSKRVSDQEFMTTEKITEDDIAQTAANRGLTREQVIKLIRTNRGYL